MGDGFVLCFRSMTLYWRVSQCSRHEHWLIAVLVFPLAAVTAMAAALHAGPNTPDRVGQMGTLPHQHHHLREAGKEARRLHGLQQVRLGAESRSGRATGRAEAGRRRDHSALPRRQGVGRTDQDAGPEHHPAQRKGLLARDRLRHDGSGPCHQRRRPVLRQGQLQADGSGKAARKPGDLPLHGQELQQGLDAAGTDQGLLRRS